MKDKEVLKNKETLILLTAGGTGGHVFPAEALARELLGRGYSVALVTDRRGGKFGDDLPVPVYRVRASALGRGFVKKFKSMFVMAVGVAQALRLVGKLRPAAIVGFGGYSTFPALYAAAKADIPIILHDQNAILGRANATLLTKAKLLATSFPSVKGMRSGHTARIVQTGNPVRPAFTVLRGQPYAAPAETGPIRILVLGGSLGARIFSQVVPKAMAMLPESLRSRLMVVQQARAEDLEAARATYAAGGIEAELAPFFRDVPERMANAHLCICRAGGSTVAELSVIGRPAILVPYAAALAGEQMANAEHLAGAGGAWLIPENAFTPDSLAVRLESLLSMPHSLTKTAAAARAAGITNAADRLADCVLSVCGVGAVKLAVSPINPDQDGAENMLAISTYEKSNS